MYTLEVQEIFNSLPKEYEAQIRRIIYLCHIEGAEKVMRLVKDFAAIPIDQIEEYIVGNINDLGYG